MARGDRSRPTRERTAEERERDREERARRRGELPAEALAPPPPIEEILDVEAPAEEPLEIESPVTEAPVEPTAVEAPVEYLPEEDALPEIVEPVAFEALAASDSPPPPPTIGLPPPLSPELGGPAKPAPGAGRSPLARIGALVALLAVIAAVVLILVPLLRPEHTKTIAAPVEVKVVVPEGKTRAQIAEIAAADHLTGDYAKAARRSSVLNARHYGAPHGTSDLEGFLFPATYDMTVGEPVERLVEEQLAAFRENFTESQIARAHTLHVTPYELLTVASMVEREAQIPGDRAKIAAVIYNRLREGIPLGIDAAIYYAVEQRKKIATYTHELTESQLHIDSPYNTRTHTGLPPTPISNPGNASIHAAAYPAHVSYLYYVAAADGCGEQVFSNTQAEFETNVAAYHAAVSKNGGHPPTCKHER